MPRSPTKPGRRAFETDALTAYRRLPLAVVLPRTTEEVARACTSAATQGVNVVPRGAGTSLAGRRDAAGGRDRRRPLQDEPHPGGQSTPTATRASRPASPISRSRRRSRPDGFFYAPDPSSQLACTIGGNIAMNSGGAHCLKYGVTTNNLLGVRLVTFDGDVIDIGGPALDAAGPRFPRPDLRLGGPARHRHRGVGAHPARWPRARARCCSASTLREDASRCVAAIIGAGIVPVAMEYMDKLAIEICENFAHAGYPLDVEAMLIIEVEGSKPEMTARARAHHRRSRRPMACESIRELHVGDGERADLEGPQIRLRRDRPHRRLHLHGRHGADRPAARGACGASAKSAPPTACASPMCSTPATATCIR